MLPEKEYNIRGATKADFSAILALNETFVHYLSPLDEASLLQLFTWSRYCRVIEAGGKVAGFMLVFAKGSPYESANYTWFTGRYDDVLYIDRVVISADHQGQGLGRLMYDDLAALGKRDGMRFLGCEYNSQPLNAGSAKFHKAYGFREVGTRQADASKTVSLQLYDV